MREFFLHRDKNKALTHLRYLFPYIKNNPQKSDRLISIVLDVINKPKDPFYVLLSRIKTDFSVCNSWDSIVELGKLYSASSDPNLRWVGDYIWRLDNG